MTHSTPMWKEESKFLVFSVDLTFENPDPLNSILILDQVLIGEPSVYWTDVLLTRDLVVTNTDAIIVNDSSYRTHLKRWEMEDSRRELRLTIDSRLWNQLDALWQCHILKQDSLQSAKEAFLPQDTLLVWKRGETPLWIGLFSILFVWSAGYKSSTMVRLMIVVFGIGMSIVPLLPVDFRYIALLTCLLGLIFRPIRWLSLGLCGLFLTHPTWVGVGSVVLGSFHHLCTMVIFRSKNGN